MTTIYILIIIIAFLLVALIWTWLYLKMRIRELEIYGYTARDFIRKCGLTEEWEKYIDEIKNDISL